MTTLGEMTMAVLLTHADREQFLQELGVRTSIHPIRHHLCIYSSPHSRGVNISTPTAVNIVKNALAQYQFPFQLERERIAQRSREEQARAKAAEEAIATADFTARR